MSLKPRFPTLLSVPGEHGPRILADPEYLAHCRNIALILAHSHARTEAKWKLKYYEKLANPLIEVDRCTD